jgi:hypothetical protein
MAPGLMRINAVEQVVVGNDRDARHADNDVHSVCFDPRDSGPTRRSSSVSGVTAA